MHQIHIFILGWEKGQLLIFKSEILHLVALDIGVGEMAVDYSTGALSSISDFKYIRI